MVFSVGKVVRKMTKKEINKLGAEHLKKRMEIHKLNQSEVDKLTGVPQNRISRIIRNKNKISLPDFVKMCEVLHKDFSEYFYEVTGGHNHKQSSPDSKYYVNFIPQKSITSDSFQPKSPLARLMLHSADCASSPSHKLPQAPSFIPVFPQDQSIPTCIYDRYYLRFCVADGVWGPPSLFGYSNQIIRNLQLESCMDQGICLDRLC